MKKQKSIKFNFVMNIILTMSSFIFPLITFPYVSRILLPEGTGKINFATSVISYFAMFAQLGIPTYGIRACARVRDDFYKLSKTVQEIFIINLIMSILAYIVFAVVLYNVPRMHTEKTLFLIISMTIIFNTIGMEWLYKALEQYTYITIRSIIFKVIALIMMFLFVKEQKDYVLYGAITIFASSASNICNFINVHKYVQVRPIGNYNLKQHIKAVVVFFAMSCATTIYTNLDSVMLGFMKTDIDVGYYGAAVKIKTILVSIVTALGTVLLPRASYYCENGMKDEFIKITRKAINFVILFSVPMVVYFTMYAQEGIFFLSGRAYEGAVLPMQIIMPTLLFIGLTNIMGIQMLIPMGKEKVVLFSEVVGAIVDLIINFILIPKMASAGAAIGTLVAEIVVWIVQLAFLHGLVRESYKKVRYAVIIVAVLMGSVLSIWIKLFQLNPFLSLVISAILFWGTYITVLIMAKEELVIEIIRQYLCRIKKIK